MSQQPMVASEGLGFSCPAVSVLVPVYNVARYLRECLDSLMGQSLRDLQIVCIDDGSTDESPSILKEYAERDSRIEVITKPNSGYGASMNIGLAHARGKYVGILEPDDYAEPTMFQSLYELAESHACDVVKSCYYLHSTDGDLAKDVYFESLAGCPYGHSFTPLEEQFVLITPASIWSAIYRAEFLRQRGINFLETPGASFQDTSFNFKCLASAQSVALTNDAYVHYRVDNAGSSSNAKSKVFCICDEYKEIWSFARSNQRIFDALCKRIPEVQLSGYRWNLDRLSPELQRGFYDVFVREFLQLKDEGLIDEELFTCDRKPYLHEMLQDPGAFFRRHYEPVDESYKQHGVKLSVVVPAYNDEGTLERAVRSCLSQMGEGLEVVIVDDCSSDSTGDVADGLAAQEPERVRVVHNANNRKALESRKIGFEASWGEYVMFLDADDELSEGCCSAALDLVEKSGADITAFSILPCYEENEVPDDDLLEGRKHLFGVVDVRLAGSDVVHASYRDAAGDASICWSMCGKLYRREVLCRAFDYADAGEMFYGDDAYFYFVAASLARLLVASAIIPPYKYHMGPGDTFTDKTLSSSEFAKTCLNVEAANRVRTYLELTGRFDVFGDDYSALRFRLLQDPVNRYPVEVEVAERGKAFDGLVAAWPPAEAISVMAAVHWHEPATIADAARDAVALRSKTSARDSASASVRSVAIACDSLMGTEHIQNEVVGLCRLLCSGGYDVLLLADEDVELPASLAEGVAVERLPRGLDSYGTQCQRRLTRLRELLLEYSVDSFVSFCRSHIVPWDLMIARSVGAACVYHAAGTFEALCDKGGFPAKLPTFCALASAVVCGSAQEAAFWEPFVGAAFELPMASALSESDILAFWSGVLSCTCVSRPMKVPLFEMWEALLDSFDEVRGARNSAFNENRSLSEELARANDELLQTREALNHTTGELERVSAERDGALNSKSFKVGYAIGQPLRVLRGLKNK